MEERLSYYDASRKTDDLVVFPMEQAFCRMKSISANNGLVYEADFVNGKVKEQGFDYYGDPLPYSKEYELEEGLSSSAVSK